MTSRECDGVADRSAAGHGYPGRSIFGDAQEEAARPGIVDEAQRHFSSGDRQGFGPEPEGSLAEKEIERHAPS